MDTTSFKQFMTQLSAESGEYLRHHFYTYKNVFKKDQGGTITNVELDLETTILRRIHEQFPEHGIVVLDRKSVREDAEYVWIVDPLDGSSHFSRNIPIYATTLALQHKGETTLSAVNIPQVKELYVAEKGAGAALNGIEIRVSNQEDVSKAYVYAELPEEKFTNQEDVGTVFSKRLRMLDQLILKCAQVETFRIGAVGQCMVASGAFDAYIDLSSSSKKLAQAASQLILSESGAEIVALDEKDGFVRVLAGNKKLTKELISVIS